MLTTMVLHDGKLLRDQPAGSVFALTVNGTEPQPVLVLVSENASVAVEAVAQFVTVMGDVRASTGVRCVHPTTFTTAVLAAALMLDTETEKPWVESVKDWPATSREINSVFPEDQRCTNTVL